MQEINSTISRFYYINGSHTIKYIKKKSMKMISQLLSNLCQKKKKYILVAYFIKVAFWGTNIQRKKEKRVDNDV